MTRYPITLEDDDNGTVLVSFPDFPEAVTFGDTTDEAIARALDALETVIAAYIQDKRPIPKPSEIVHDEAVVTLSALVAAKVQLYQSMQQARVNKTQLAKRLGVHLPQVDRLFNIRHGSQIGQLEAAATALGKRLLVAIVDDPQGEEHTILRSTNRMVIAKLPRRPSMSTGRRRNPVRIPGTVILRKSELGLRRSGTAVKKR